MPQFAVIGPPRAGKTVLVSCTREAARNREQTSLGPWSHVDVLPRNDEAIKLFSDAKQMVTHGSPPFEGTRTVSSYEFSFETTQRKRFPRLRRSADVSSDHRFKMVDGPGGTIFPTYDDASADPADIDRARHEMTRALAACDGFVLCLDPRDDRTAIGIYTFLEPVLDALYATQRPRRVAICLTRADEFFAEHGSEARNAADRTSATDVCLDLLGLGCRNALAVGLRQGWSVAFGWVSAYGFQSDGRPNHDPATGCLATTVEGHGTVAARDGWRPYQVLEPFLFVATGEPLGQELMR